MTTPGPNSLVFTCPSCGAQTAYAPGTSVTRCPSCGFEQQIASDGVIVEHSYDDWAAQPHKPVATVGSVVLQCQGCGATIESDLLAGTCQFCAGVLIAQQQPPDLIAPEAVVPFGIDKPAASKAVVGWLGSRWFAPTSLKKVGGTEGLKGTYIPHWTFDAHTETDYTGSRGEYYYTTETYTVSDGEGNSHQETRTVRHTQWWPASGHVRRDFDDVSVVGSTKVRPDKLGKMGPWALGSAKEFQPSFLAGYTALRYDVDPDQALVGAREQMQGAIAQDCRYDIGGDEQMVTSMNVSYAQNMFKLMLLPIWIATYLYAGKTWQVLVNANTGDVVGDRPYSKVKITLAAIVLVLVIVALFLVLGHRQQGG